jgi:RES domain-containing protein
MEVFRLSTTKHSRSLSASGAANRWNTIGQTVLYTGATRALATLELIVHIRNDKPIVPYEMMIISLPDDSDLIQEIKPATLPTNWRTYSAYSTLQSIGSKWYKENKFLIMKVPSAIIPQEHNYVINTSHSLYSKGVILVRQEDYFFDDRLFIQPLP